MRTHQARDGGPISKPPFGFLELPLPCMVSGYSTSEYSVCYWVTVPSTCCFRCFQIMSGMLMVPSRWDTHLAYCSLAGSVFFVLELFSYQSYGSCFVLLRYDASYALLLWHRELCLRRSSWLLSRILCFLILIRRVLVRSRTYGTLNKMLSMNTHVP